MFDPDELKNFKLNMDAFRASQQPTKPKSQPKKGGRGGFLTSLISEGGAIGGGAGGAAIGTGILPGIGTLAGGLIGAGVGAFTGRVAENKVRDDRLGLGDAAKEGALSAVFGAGPLRLGKFGYEAVRGGVAAARPAEKVLTEVVKSRGIPVTSVESALKGQVGATLPTITNRTVKALSDTEFVSRFKPLATAAARDVPGIGKTFTSTGTKDSLELILKHLASNASKGDTRKIVERLFPEGLDSPAKNSLVRSLEAATDPSAVRNILKQADVSVRSQQVGAIRPESLQVSFRGAQPSSTSVLPAKPQPSSLVETTLPKTSLAQALQDAGTSAVNMNARRAAGNKLTNAGEGLIAKEFRLTPTQQSNFKNLHGEEAVSVLRKYGIKKPEDLQTQIKPLQDAFDGVVDSIPAASKSEVQAAMQKIYKPLMNSPVLTRQQLGQSLKAQADAITKKAGAQIPAAELNTLRKSFDEAVSYTQRGTNEFTVNKKSADAIRKLLQGKADDAGITVNGQTFKDIGLELRKLRRLDDDVGKQSYLGSGSLPVSLTNSLGAVGGGVAAGGPAGAAAGLAGTILLNSQKGRSAITNGALQGGERLANRGSNPYGLGAVAGRIAPVGLAGALLGSQGQSSGLNQSQPMTTMETNNSAQPNAANMPELSQSDANMSTNGGPLAPENLQNSVQQILANGGSMKDAAEFVGLAEALQKMSGGTKPKPLTASQANRAAAANNALRDLPMIAEAIESGKLGGAKVLPGSSTQIGRRLLGTENLDAALFNIADNILRARTGAAAPEAEVKRFMDTFLPAATDSKQAKIDKLSRAIRELQGYVNPVEASADTLEEALL